MKLSFIADDEKYIYDLRKVVLAGNKLCLDWKTFNLYHFLVIFAEKKEQVQFTPAENQDKLRNILSTAMPRLLEDKMIYDRKTGWQIYYVTHEALRRENGMAINEKPGVYGVYGVQIEGEDMQIYLNDVANPTQHTFTMTLDVTIESFPYYVEKGFLFKKTRVYSGFHQVRLPRAHPEMVGGTLKYSIRQHTYTFPDDVVKHGGSFYVHVPEHEHLSFLTNNPGIKIK